MADSTPLELATMEEIGDELRKRCSSFILFCVQERTAEVQRNFRDWGGTLGGIACLGLAEWARAVLSDWYSKSYDFGEVKE